MRKMKGIATEPQTTRSTAARKDGSNGGNDEGRKLGSEEGGERRAILGFFLLSSLPAFLILPFMPSCEE
jgi:hypothetical protein